MANGQAGAPLGNSNAANSKRYRSAIERALAHKHGNVADGLFNIAQHLVRKASEGDSDAAREIADRLDGKPTQVVGGDPDMPPASAVLLPTDAGL